MDNKRKQQKKQSAPSKEQEKLEVQSLTDCDKQFLNSLKDLCTCCLNILGAARQKESKSYVSIETYSKSLTSKSIKLSAHRSLYVKLYKIYSENILSSEDNVAWMNECSSTVSVHLGADSQNARIKEMNIRIPLSVVYNEADSMREKIDRKKYSNPNEEERDKFSIRYQYADIFQNFFIKAVAEALTPEHKDYAKLIKLHEIFRDKTHLKKTTNEDGSEDEEDDEGDGAGGLAKMINKVSGSDNVNKNKVNKLFNKMLDNDGLLDNIPTVIKQGQEGMKGGSKKDVFRSISAGIMPQIEAMMEGLDEIMDGKDSEEESSEEED